MVSSFFADIFKNNALNNAVLPLTVPDGFLQKIFQQGSEGTLTINLEKQTINIDATDESESFDINPYKKTCMINGYDDIDYLLSIKEEIQEFETQRSVTQ